MDKVTVKDYAYMLGSIKYPRQLLTIYGWKPKNVGITKLIKDEVNVKEVIYAK